MKKKNGFTLIELLAVIIILGILMIIAIPSVTKYISDSRKNSYVDTAKEIIGAARNLVNSGKLGMYDTNTTYYIPVSAIQTENALKSPYGDFVDDAAYVVVTYNGTGYNYYWISVDDAGQGVKKIISYDKLESNDIQSDIDSNEIKDLVEHTGVGNREYIQILKNDGKWNDPHMAEDNVSELGGSSAVIVYPEGTTKQTVNSGDIITIGEEEFYVVKRDGKNLILLSHYNLKVGSIYDTNHNKLGEYTSSDEGYGRQDPNMKGVINGSDKYYGTVLFSDRNYWVNKVGDGLKYSGNYCPNMSDTNCAYVYDSNSNLYQYVNAYKTYLDSLGVYIKEARLMSIEEVKQFRDINMNAYIETSYWVGSVFNPFGTVWGVFSNSYVTGNVVGLDYYYGVRPVIVI